MAAPELTSRRLRRLLAAGALLTLATGALAGCSASGTDRSARSGGDSDSYVSEQVAPGLPQSAPDAGAPGPGAPGGESKDSSTTGGGSGTGAAAPVSLLTGNRDLIRTGQLGVQVPDLTAAAARARAYVATQGGQISSENSVLTPDGNSSGPLPGSFVQLVIALPPDALDASMDALAELGELASRTQSVEDVTLQVVDLQARTATMRASIDRVRALMDRATSIADVVALESELSRREADLESMTGQLQSLQSQAAVSTLVLTLSSQAAAAPEDEDSTGAAGALRDSLRALGNGASAVIVGLAAALPFAVLIAALAAAGWLVARPRRRSAGTPAGAAENPDTP